MTPWPYPNEAINTKGPQYNRNALSARGVRLLAHFYTPRNLWALSSIWTRASRFEPSLRSHLLFAATAMFGRIERMTNYKFGKGGNCCLKGQLYFPSLAVEDNVFREFESKAKHIADFLKSASFFRAETAKSLVRCGDAGHIKGIPDNSVDYVFTDPPFGSNIYYSEVNWLYECWLGRKTQTESEAVVHRKNDRGSKNIDDYRELMSAAFCEVFRVLKPGRYATIEFNNSDGRIFEAIKEAVRCVGFEIENMVFLDKIQKTFKQIKGGKGEEDVVGHDVIFNIRKPSPSVDSSREDARPTSAEKQIADVVVEVVKQHLEGLPTRINDDPTTYSDEHRTTPFLNTMLMTRLIPRGVKVEHLNLPFIESVCSRYFKKIDNNWYLPGQNVATKANSLLFEEEPSVSDEASAVHWLRHSLGTSQMRIGELRPHWMKATVKQLGDLSIQLERLLRENFWLDRSTRRWRIPTAYELAELNDHERQRACHDAERLLEGKLSPHPTDAEILGWIEKLYSAAGRLEEEALGLVEPGEEPTLPADLVAYYRMMPRLLQSVLKENVDALAYTRATRQCRTAARKIQEHDDCKEAEAQSRSGPRQGKLFD